MDMCRTQEAASRCEACEGGRERVGQRVVRLVDIRYTKARRVAPSECFDALEATQADQLLCMLVAFSGLLLCRLRLHSIHMAMAPSDQKTFWGAFWRKLCAK